MKAWQHLPTQTIAQRKFAVHLELILRKNAVLPRRSAYIRARYRKVQRSRRTLQKIAERISGEGPLKDEVAEIIRSVRRSKALQVEVPNAANISADLQRVLSKRPRHVIGNLQRLRLSDARLVTPNRSKPNPRTEVERRKCVRIRMLADIHTLQTKLLQSSRPLNREAHACSHVRESKPKLIQQLRSDRICVRDQQTAIVNRIHIIGQQWIRILRSNVLPAEPRISRLLVIDRLVQANISAIRLRRSRLEVLVVVTIPINIRQRIIVQQRLRRRADAGLRNHSRAERRKVPVALHHLRNQKLLRYRGRAAIALIVRKEERLIVPVIKMRNCYRPAQRTAERIELLRSLARKPIRNRIQGLVLQILKQASVIAVRSAFRR